MRSAWEQIGDVLTVNATIRRAQLATKASSAAYSKTLVRARIEPATALASPVFSEDHGQPDHAARAGRSAAGCRGPRCRRRSASCCGRADGWRARCCRRTRGRTRSRRSCRASTTGRSRPRRRRRRPDGATLESVTDAIRPAAWVGWLLRNAWWLVAAAARARPADLGGMSAGASRWPCWS